MIIKTLILVSSLITSLCSATVCRADDLDLRLEPCAAPEMTITDLRLKGEPGIWLSAPLGACVLRDLEQLEMVRSYSLELEQSLNLSETESRVLRKANGSLRLSLSSTQDALILQTEATRSEQKKSKKAKRRGIISSVVIGLAGAGLGIVAGVVISQ